MIKRGVLFQGAFSPCFSHSLDDVAYFVEAFSQTILVLQEAENVGLENLLLGEAAKPVFRKLL
jgi:spore coat polysaccharide biosynthesis protein SpsF